MTTPHLFGTLEGCCVSRSEDLEGKMKKIAEKFNFTVMGKLFVQFEPQGTTGFVFILAESHASVHTWPELSLVKYDVFCCSEGFDPEACAEYFGEVFGAEHNTWEVKYR